MFVSIARSALLSGVMLVGAMLSACGTHRAAQAQGAAMPAPQVTVAQVIAKPVTEFDEFTGRFEAVERVEIRPRVSGYIASVNFPKAARSRRASAFVIDPRPYEADTSTPRRSWSRRGTGAAKSERERAMKLLQQHAISQEEFDTRVAGIEQADANVEAAEAALDTAALN